MPHSKCYKTVARGIVPAALALILLLGLAGVSAAAVPDRVTRPVDVNHTRTLSGQVHRLAQAQFDRGAVDPAMPLEYMLVLFQPSAAQQTDLDGLLVDQQNPSSPHFHQWLTPEEFGNRFGLSSGDHSKVVAWLTSQGLSVKDTGRGRNWVAFSGTAAQVSQALHTPIHHFEVNGETHYANTADPSVPEALADVIGGFLGLNDFHLQSFARLVPPDYTSGSSHFLVPEDFATIYDVAPIYKGGIDGTGQSIAVVGESDVLLSDIRAFRTRYNLPANDPKMILYGGSDPGINGAQVEGNLDLEWAGAIAPQATIYYVFGGDAITAIAVAVSLNVAPIVSISYGGCEIGYRLNYWRTVAQQANAQGITILSASGDSGAAGCDPQGYMPFAAGGRMVDFPAVLPEITAVGGTQFVEGTGTYWSTTNSVNLGSALSYIPEAAWNESSNRSLGSTGGGASVLYSKPLWQNGPGVPSDGARDIPDIALSAATHDAYAITYNGASVFVGGTSCSAPSMAGIVALLNHYQVGKGIQKQPGLGNINPQLYRLAQSAPSAFHDVTSGNNIVSCAQGSPDCSTGSFGYQAGPGYDLATGLGSIDANNLFSQWNSKTSGVTVSLFVNVAKATLNDSVGMTATVAPATGTGTPTGTVDFSVNGVKLGSTALRTVSGHQEADLFFPVYLIGSTGTFALIAQYSGDAAFSGGGTIQTIQVTTPTGAAAIVPSAPDTVWPSPPDAQGLSWQTTLSLREAAGVAAMITGFTIDGQAQTLAQYFPSSAIPPLNTVSATVVLRNMATPVTRTFGFTGVDVNGNAWSRQISVNYFSLPPGSIPNLAATPLVVNQNTAADPSCQWAVQLNLDEAGGNVGLLVDGLAVGGVDRTAQLPAIFGTPRLTSWAGLQGTLCFGGITPPATDTIAVDISGLGEEVAVSFVGPPANPVKITAAPPSLSLTATSASQRPQTLLTVDLSDETQTWTASVFPNNRTTGWLSLSQYSGTGQVQITLTATGTGFEPGAYYASIVIQSPRAVPQYVSIPVMFVLGPNNFGMAIQSVLSSTTYQAVASPGMVVAIFGTQLAGATQTGTGSPLPYTLAGVSATVNGIAAPIVYVSSTQVNIQVPFEVGAGPAVVGLNNNGQIAGWQIRVTPSAPGINADSLGNMAPNSTVPQGGTTTLYMNGAGEVVNLLRTGFSASSATAYRPQLPLSVTVGGVPAFVVSAALTPGYIGVTAVRFTVPASVPKGKQQVVVTVNGVSSPPVFVTVQ